MFGKTFKLFHTLRMMEKLLFTGPPFSGKGTQAKYLKDYGFQHISTGDLIRASEDPAIVKYREIDYPQGKLLPDEKIFELIQGSITEPKYILDGAVRTLPQAEYVNKNNLVKKVIFFNTPEEVLLDRLLRRNEGRTDDNIEAFENRMRIYREETLPTFPILKRKSLFYEINGDDTPENINREVKTILDLY